MTAPGYLIIPAPEQVKPVDPSLSWKADLVDYSRHPAYADFVRSATIGHKIAATLGFSAKFMLLLTKRLIRYEMIPYEFRSARTMGERIGFVTAGLRNMIGIGTEKRPPCVIMTPVADHLQRFGIAAVQIPPDRLEELRRLSADHFARLEARRGRGANRREFDESRTTADRRDSPELFALVEKVLEESGIAAAASVHLGRKARLADVNPQINDRSDSFWRDIFEDRPGEKLPIASYHHRDASGGDLKAIFYFSDVGPTNGPFTYVVGSNRMAISAVDNLLREANDHNGLSATSLAARKKFAALPAKLRQKGAFGNDLPDDAPLAKAIEQGAWEVTAPAGSIVLFDTKGIHRGGMVDEGERRVMTCVLG